MQCRLCHEPAGWFRRTCPTCTHLDAVVRDSRGQGLSGILDRLIATGASQAQIETFLDAEREGGGSVRDQIVADMTNHLMGALGQSSGQRAADVKRIRARGGWRRYDQRPEE